MDYGKVPAQSSKRMHPSVRPEMPIPTITITPPTSQPPQPMGFTNRTYETFEAPQHISHPYHLSSQEPLTVRNFGGSPVSTTSNPAITCPVCFTGINYFRLPNDPTTSVFCGSCRQPYHFCPVHRVSLAGMGPNAKDPSASQCQCQHSQSFLGDDHWNSCFNT